MKNNLLAFMLAFVLLTSFSAQAQNRGIRSGVAFTTFAKTGDLADNDPLSVHFTVGAFRAIPIQGSWNVMPELNYSQRSRSGKNLLPGIGSEVEYSVHYLQLPLQMQYVNTDIVRRSGAQLHVNAGPYMAYALSDKVSSKNGNTQLPEALIRDEKHDYGLSMGMGYQRPVGSNFLRFDMKYDMGLAEVANQPDDFRTKALSFTLGYAF